MQRSNTAKEMRAKLAFLENRKADLEQGRFMGETSSEIADAINWFERVFFKMPPHERQAIKNDWNTYYRKCATSPEAQNFFLMRDAFAFDATEVMPELKEKTKQIAASMERIQTPTPYDPEMWNCADWALAYREAKSEIEEIENLLENNTPASNRTESVGEFKAW
jgi:hypothetical protein